MLCLVAYYDITIYLYDNNLISSVARRASRALLFTFFLSVNYFFIFFFLSSLIDILDLQSLIRHW